MTLTMGSGEESESAIISDIAIGEALYASTLATIILTGQVAYGWLSHDQAVSMLDGATLVLERRRGADSTSVTAVDYARDRINMLMSQLQQLRSAKPPQA